MKSRVAKTLGLVVAMVACVGMTVFAAPSPSASTPVTGVAAKDKNGNTVKVEMTSTIPAQFANAVATLKTEAGLKDALGSDYNENMVIADIVEVTAPDHDFANDGPLTLTFAANVSASSKAQILHGSESGWKKEATTVSAGAVSCTVDSLSPFAVVVDKTTLPSGVTTSPKTSASAVSVIAVLGLAATAGAFGLKKKSYVK